MDVEHLVESVLGKWSQRGYIEEEMVGTIAEDLAAEVIEHTAQGTEWSKHMADVIVSMLEAMRADEGLPDEDQYQAFITAARGG